MEDAGARAGGRGRRGTRRQHRATMVAGGGGEGVGMSARKIHLGRLQKYAAEVGWVGGVVVGCMCV